MIHTYLYTCVYIHFWWKGILWHILRMFLTSIFMLHICIYAHFFRKAFYATYSQIYTFLKGIFMLPIQHIYTFWKAFFYATYAGYIHLLQGIFMLYIHIYTYLQGIHHDAASPNASKIHTSMWCNPIPQGHWIEDSK